MKQYIIYYIDGAIDYLNAYSVKFKNNRAVFDLGRHRKYTLIGVLRVELA